MLKETLPDEFSSGLFSPAQKCDLNAVIGFGDKSNDIKAVVDANSPNRLNQNRYEEVHPD